MSFGSLLEKTWAGTKTWNLQSEPRKYLEDGDHVICAISQKKIPLENLTYWNVEEQEAYFSYVEASMKRDLLDKN